MINDGYSGSRVPEVVCSPGKSAQTNWLNMGAQRLEHELFCSFSCFKKRVFSNTICEVVAMLIEYPEFLNALRVAVLSSRGARLLPPRGKAIAGPRFGLRWWRA